MYQFLLFSDRIDCYNNESFIVELRNINLFSNLQNKCKQRQKVKTYKKVDNTE